MTHSSHQMHQLPNDVCYKILGFEKTLSCKYIVEPLLTSISWSSVPLNTSLFSQSESDVIPRVTLCLLLSLGIHISLHTISSSVFDRTSTDQSYILLVLFVCSGHKYVEFYVRQRSTLFMFKPANSLLWHPLGSPNKSKFPREQSPSNLRTISLNLTKYCAVNWSISWHSIVSNSTATAIHRLYRLCETGPTQ